VGSSLVSRSEAVYSKNVEQIETVIYDGLSSAPEFGPDGEWPPVNTSWVPVRATLLVSETFFNGDINSAAACIVATNISRLARVSASLDPFKSPTLPWHFSTQREVLRPNYLEGILHELNIPLEIIRIEFKGRMDKPSRISLVVRLPSSKIRPIDTGHLKALRRVVHYQRWQRRDPVTKLPPGASHELTHSVTTGLSVEYSQTLAASLGMSLGSATGIHAQLSSQLQQQLGFQVDISAQEQTNTRLTLSNQSDHNYALYSLWHVDNRITVNTLSLRVSPKTYEKSPAYSINEPVYSSWLDEQSVEFVTEIDPHLTYAEVGRS